MSWSLIKSIQNETDLRLILPFGLAVRLGDVVSVGRDGNLALEGSSASLLGQPAGEPRPAGAVIDLMRQSGTGTTCVFRAAGTASTLFPSLPSTTAGFDIGFDSQEGWVLACSGRSLTSLDEVNRFRQPILDAYLRGVWKPDWALVISIATVDRMTLLASASRNTQVALSVTGTFASDSPLEAKLT